MALDPTQQEHADEAVGLEDGCWLRLQRLFRAARRDLVARVNHLADETRGGTVSWPLRPAGQTPIAMRAHHAASILWEVDQVLGATTPRMLEALQQSTGRAMAMGVRQAVAEIRAAEPALAPVLAAIDPAIPIDAVLRISDPQKALLTRFGEGISQAAADSLGTSVTLGEGIRPAAKRLGAEVEKKAWELERIARTEMNNAMNASHLERITDLARKFPQMGVKKQWSANVRDGRCCEQCAAMDGQVREVDEDFNAPDGWSGPAPSKHPNCRCRVNAWTPRRGGKQPEYGMAGDVGEGVGGMAIKSLAELPVDVRKRLSPSQQNAHRRALNALAKDALPASQIHVDVPLGTRGKRRKKPILKADAPRRYTLGVVYEPDVIDSQDDFADAAEIEKACWDFNREYLGTGKAVEKGALGLQHACWDDGHGEIIESYIAPADMTIGDELVTKGTWLLGTIWSPTNFAKVQRGELTGLSMGGRARREPPDG